MGIRSSNPGLDRLGPTPSGLRRQPLPPAFGKSKKLLTKKDCAQIERYRARMAKMFTIERLDDTQKTIRRRQNLSRGNRKAVKITMPKFNLPPMGDE